MWAEDGAGISIFQAAAFALFWAAYSGQQIQLYVRDALTLLRIYCLASRDKKGAINQRDGAIAHFFVINMASG